jgi:hypothetical protein
MRRLIISCAAFAGLAILALPGSGGGADKDKGEDKDKGFVKLFDGKTLEGWKVSAKSGHSRASENKSGGRWEVKDGAIIGSQDKPGNGGLLITKEKFGDFEVALEMKNDFGPDSGLFLRSTEDGKAYQAMIDYYPKGNLMGVYGEGIGGFSSRNFSFGNKPSVIEATPKEGKTPLLVSPKEWPKFWKHGEWNELRARITGNPPKIVTWIKGVKFTEFEGDKKLLGDTGGIALQVHGGGDHTKEFVRYRNIRVKKLK